MRTLVLILSMVLSERALSFCGPTGLCNPNKTVEQYHEDMGMCILGNEDVLDEALCFRGKRWNPGGKQSLFDEAKYEVYLQEHGISNER